MAEHWCKEHQVVFFKKGGMKGYAHPVMDEEGNPTGQWCNEPKQEEVPSPKEKEEPSMSKEDWAGKDRITRKSIERQKSLELATNWAIALLNSPSFTKKELLSGRSIIMAARDYEEYLNTGEIPVRLVIEKLDESARAKAEGKGVKTSPKSRLVEEAIKMGAEEIEGKEDTKTK